MNEWIEVMPAIPLARSVPVVRRWDDGTLAAGIVVELSTAPLTGEVEVMWVDDLGSAHADDLRVDLEDPQGFAYALRWLGSQMGPHGFSPESDLLDVGLWAWAHAWAGNAWRMKLAQACRDRVAEQAEG